MYLQNSTYYLLQDNSFFVQTKREYPFYSIKKENITYYNKYNMMIYAWPVRLKHVPNNCHVYFNQLFLSLYLW